MIFANWAEQPMGISALLVVSAAPANGESRRRTAKEIARQSPLRAYHRLPHPRATWD